MNTYIADEKVVEQLTKLPKVRLALFRDIEINQQGVVLLKVTKRVRASIVEDLDNNELIALLNYLDPDKVTDIIQELKSHRAKKITDKLSDSIREKVETLLSFNPRTAAGLMNLDYVVVSPKAHFDEVSEDIKEHESRTGKFPAILVVDNGKLLGELPGNELVIHHRTEKVADHFKRVPSVHFDNDEHKVVNSFLKHPHNKVVVLDEDESILGVIHSDDLLNLIDKKTSNDLYGFAGVSKEEDANDGIRAKVRNRYLWLIINLGTAFLAASVVARYEGVISKFTLLAVYMPIVAGMGGNAATQTLAVAVRGLVMKEIDLRHGISFALRELGAGIVNGLINGSIVALVAIVINKSPMLGLVLALSMIGNLIIASVAGAIIPLIMKSLGKDPATSATIFITTCTDVGGFFIFLSLAQLLLV
ncbi:magnesium transporter [Candidatus Saccharibacteria bacterium]|nr:magnesium transporter [Candidatus Saccharibacteria bacterium]